MSFTTLRKNLNSPNGLPRSFKRQFLRRNKRKSIDTTAATIACVATFHSFPNSLHVNRATSGDIDYRQQLPNASEIVVRHSPELI
jgi:hypothetical protein